MTDLSRYKIALDVMGADAGAATIVMGGVEAARRLGDRGEVVLVGRRDEITPVLERLTEPVPNISVEHAGEVVTMDMAATDGVRMRDSSIAVATRLVKERRAHAFVSPGNTGAVMATSLLTLGRIEGVSRPAITTIFPTTTGRPTVVLDVGANADCKPHHLAQFAVMGSVYSSLIFNHEAPRVGLLSIGEERSKGNELIFNAQKLMQNLNINFVGNVEGRDILAGTVDVVVTDGFTGNILLKFGESIQPMLVNALQRQIQTNIFSRIAVMFLLPFLRRLKRRLDYAEAGGAPLLGVDGVVIICHGRSNAKAISNAIMAAYEMARRNITDRIREDIIANHAEGNNGLPDSAGKQRNRVACTTSGNEQH